MFALVDSGKNWSPTVGISLSFSDYSLASDIISIPFSVMKYL
jgi:hypothetical protein